MSSHRGIRLMLAIALVLSLLVVLAPGNPIGAKLLRKKDDDKRNPSGQEKASLRRQNPQNTERTFKTRDFKDMPLAIRRVRNLHSDNWHKDLEIEVRNTSTKPIYSILAYLEFPDDKVEGSGVSGIAIVFGERKYIDLTRIGDPQDPHLNPGDTYVFTIPEKLRKGLKVQHERSPQAFKRLELHFQLISFGDGTGFLLDEPADTRIRKSSSGGIKKHHAYLSRQKPSESERVLK